MSRLLDVTSEIPTDRLHPTVTVRGAPRAGSRLLAAVAGAAIGVWEITPGVAMDVEVDEIFVVLAGSATVSFEDGEVIDLGPGSVVRLEAGERTTWTIHETLRKIYVAGGA